MTRIIKWQYIECGIERKTQRTAQNLSDRTAERSILHISFSILSSQLIFFSVQLLLRCKLSNTWPNKQHKHDD